MTQNRDLMARLHDLDDAAFRGVADWHSPLLDRALPALSEVANHSKLWMAAAVGIAALGGPRGRRTAVAGMVAVGATSALANIAAKGLTRRSRPTSTVPESRRLVQPASSSFPSGHTASAAAFSGVVGDDIPALWLPLNALAAAVGFSRVYTGVHYPGDVVAGWVLGKAVAFVAGKTADRWPARSS